MVSSVVLFFFFFLVIVVSARLNDPKTIEEKESEEEKEKQRRNLRIATFGTSRTYGSGLKERTKQAYPYLLSSDVTNFAVRASGPEYPSFCTQSLIGDDARFDVITFEYWMYADESLRRLVHRLRERFPKAHMIFLIDRPPFLYYNNKTSKSLKAMIEERTEHDPIKLYNEWKNGTLVDTILEETDESDWTTTEQENNSNFIKQLASEVDGSVFELKMLSTMKESIRWHAGEMFMSDQTHFTEYGHQVVKEGMLKHILEKEEQQQQHDDNDDDDDDDAVNDWGYPDNCDVWFQTGAMKTKLEDDSRLHLSLFSPGKFALECKQGENCWMPIHNPNPTESSSLYVQIMASGPAPSIYPTTTLTIGKWGNNVRAEPLSVIFNYKVHVTKLIKVSDNALPPNSTIPLIIQPDDNYIHPDSNERLPFRITGIIVTKDT